MSGGMNKIPDFNQGFCLTAFFFGAVPIIYYDVLFVRRILTRIAAYDYKYVC